MTMTALRKEKDEDRDIFFLQYEIKKYQEKLNKLLEQDRKESKVIQDLSIAKRELNQAKKELIIYKEREIDLEKADERRNYIVPSLKKKIGTLEEEASKNELRQYFIDHEDIAKTISQRYNLPTRKILLDEQRKLFLMSDELQKRIKGQTKALRVVSDAIFRARAGIQDPNRPLASFLFVGPSGVGKTLVALTIAEQLFDQKKNLVRLDMTEFSESHSISKLIGSPPGYIGFEGKPQLEVIRERMYSVVLFDEIEKCHPEIVNILLQILDNGFLTLANGREVNFRNTIIVLTTNLGSKLYFEDREESELKEELNFELKNYFRPELLNRLDEIVFFNSLTKKAIKEIINKELETFTERVKQEKRIEVGYDEEKIVEKILQNTYLKNPSEGARQIKHYIEREIGTLVARGIVSQFLHFGSNYLLDLEEGTNEIKISKLYSLEAKKNLLKEKYE